MIHNVKCLNPRIVLNPNLFNLLSIHRKYCLNGVLYDVTPARLTHWKYDGLFYFNSYIPSLSLDNVNNFGVVDKDTGELLPMFLLVPCNMCKACQYKKSLEWKTRCICESATSKCSPLFFTLTYDNNHIKKEGVNKEDIQLFLKRLRSRLEYYDHDCSDLRYFIVAEYGTNTNRPHYHGLFWNFPYFDRMIDKIDMIRDCWQNGLVQVSPARDLSGAYCMKYMFKDKSAPVGKNETFFLTSRGKGGIGIKWLKDNFDYYRQFPQETSIKVKALDGTIHELPMPAYFQRKLYPSVSGLIPLKVRKTLDLYLNYRYISSICLDFCRKLNIRIKCNTYAVDRIFDFYKNFGLINDDYDLGHVYNYFSFIHTDLVAHMDDKDYVKRCFNYYNSLERSCAKVLNDWIGPERLEGKEDVSFIEHLKEIRDILSIGVLHKQFVDSICENIEDINLDDYMYKIENIMEKSLQKEIF